MTEVTPIGDPRQIGDAEVQYVGSSNHSHEGGHRIALNGREVLVLPDGRTTARSRSHALTEALQAISRQEPDPVQTVVGALVLAGARSIEVDGQPLLVDTSRTVASLRLDVNALGDAVEVSVAHLGDR